MVCCVVHSIPAAERRDISCTLYATIHVRLVCYFIDIMLRLFFVVSLQNYMWLTFQTSMWRRVHDALGMTNEFNAPPLEIGVEVRCLALYGRCGSSHAQHESRSSRRVLRTLSHHHAIQARPQLYCLCCFASILTLPVLTISSSYLRYGGCVPLRSHLQWLSTSIDIYTSAS